MKRTQFVGKAQVSETANGEYRMELIGDPGCLPWSEEDIGEDFSVSIARVDALESGRIEFEAMVTHKAKWLAKDMNLVEEVTLRGKGIYALELGDYNVTFTLVTPEPGASVTLTTVEPELKPCPRCGGEIYMLPGINVWTAQCRQCRSTGPVLRTKVAAINTHNERKYPELDPCPFCGGEVAFEGKSANPWAHHVAECTNCHVAMGRARRDDAVADWNRRA